MRAAQGEEGSSTLDLFHVHLLYVCFSALGIPPYKDPGAAGCLCDGHSPSVQLGVATHKAFPELLHRVWKYVQEAWRWHAPAAHHSISFVLCSNLSLPGIGAGEPEEPDDP